VPKLRVSFVFSLSLSFCFLSSRLWSEESAPPPSPAAPTEAKPQEPTSEFSVPSDLIRSAFRVTQRVFLELDGSAEAGGLRRKAEHVSVLNFLNSGNWRFLQVLPFSGLTREIYKNERGVFQMTLGNRAIANQEKISDDAWTNLLKWPQDLSKRFGFSSLDSNWGDWFEQVRSLKEEYRNAEGDVIRTQITKNGDIEKTSVIVEGRLLHEGSTRLKIRVEWTLEQGIKLSPKDLELSLRGGA
jgi:hypothetical protein